MVGLIYRATEYSPNDNVAKDAAILHAVGEQLQQQGVEVCYVHEEDLSADTNLQQWEACVSMARRWKNLWILQKAERLGVKMLNSPQAVQVTVQSRSTTLEILQAHGLPVVPFWSYEPSEDQMFQCEPELQQLLPGWVKAMHPKGVTAGDVSMVHSSLEADARIMQLATEGYTDVIVTRHLDGPLLKLYCVGEQCWPDSEYADLVRRVAHVLGLRVLGVDLILTAEGARIIDVNDFPSFSRCRNEAAAVMASLVINR